MSAKKDYIASSGRKLNTAMPYLLDTAGIILLSGSVMMLHVAAGIAVAGVGMFVLNWRFYDR
ncbi:hypothetical protein [Streptomyces alboflavus]|uniref:hypothetical protein n=1 Tax=Streptomyces alboflavus TaxID=67267 RepID=UPI0004BE768E|nr:hypothetical protein [Streptomyces alboflavus]